MTIDLLLITGQDDEIFQNNWKDKILVEDARGIPCIILHTSTTARFEPAFYVASYTNIYSSLCSIM